MDLERPRAVHI